MLGFSIIIIIIMCYGIDKFIRLVIAKRVSFNLNVKICTIILIVK